MIDRPGGGSRRTAGPDPLAGSSTATLLRRGVLILAALGIAGTTLELIFLRHWGDLTRTLVWPGVAALVIALVALLRAGQPRTVQAVRIAAVAVTVLAIAGVVLHVIENLGAGPLDHNYATTWNGLPVLEQLWLATTGGVGPAPILAPGALAEIALALLLATIRHPVLEAPSASATAGSVTRARR